MTTYHWICFRFLHEVDTAGGVKGYRFTPPRDVFADIARNPENDCFCPAGPPCAPNGLFNISVCQFGMHHYLFSNITIMQVLLHCNVFVMCQGSIWFDSHHRHQLFWHRILLLFSFLGIWKSPATTFVNIKLKLFFVIFFISHVMLHRLCSWYSFIK